MKVPLNHTLPISLCYSAQKVSKSHAKSSQDDFLCSSTTNFPWLSPTENWLVPDPNEFCHLYGRGTDTYHRKHMSRDNHPPLRDVTADTESTASLYCCMLDCVYKAVAWQRVVQIRYIINYFLSRKRGSVKVKNHVHSILWKRRRWMVSFCLSYNWTYLRWVRPSVLSEVKSRCMNTWTFRFCSITDNASSKVILLCPSILSRVVCKYLPYSDTQCFSFILTIHVLLYVHFVSLLSLEHVVV
jgi:hypothetical protein